MKYRRPDNASRYARFLGWLLLAMTAIGWAPVATAGQATNCIASSATLTLPNVNVPPGTLPGTLLGSPTAATMTFNCSNLPYQQNQNDLAARTATIVAGNTLAPLDSTNNPAGPAIKFATNVTGIALQITAGPIAASSQSGNGANGTAGYEVGGATVSGNGNSSASVSETYTAQLITTGPVTPGTINAIQPLIPFWWYVKTFTTPTLVNGDLRLGGGTTVTAAGCSVDTGSQNLTVALPTTFSNALATVGATAGKTAFNINLTCQSGALASISMTTATPAVATGVIAPKIGAGYANNVGVQLLDGNSVPVTFNSPRSLGATPQGTLSIPYYAQYYVTATPTSAGLVSGTATFTMSYQ
jgi:type 1 fimbria pilin